MKKNYLWKLYGLVACLMLSLFVVSCQKEKDEEELRREVIVNAEQVMDKVGSIFKSSETIETMAAHLGEIKAMANVEDAWQEGDAICVKIKDGGTIMWQYYPEEEELNKSLCVVPMLKKDAKRSFQRKDGSMCEEQSICLMNVINRSWEIGYDEIIAKFKDSLNWDTCIRKSEQVTLNFILNNMPDYGVIILIAHGGYFSNQHWLLTGEPWNIIITSDEYKEWVEDGIRISLVRESNDFHVLISETYLLDKLSKDFHHNSVMFSGACKSLTDNNRYCKELIRGKGLGCFVGFNESVQGTTAMNCCVSFFNEMYNGATAIEACAIARNEITQAEIEERSLQLLCYPNTCDITLVEPPDDPDDEPGLFSVSPTKKVFFSPGNLQYQASTNTWRFAEHQYDYVGADNSNICATYSGWIDLFGWGTGNNPTLFSTNDTDYGTFVDWGTNAISNGGNTANQWRTLTSAEWEYLFNNHQYGIGNVNGVGGVILLPDSWTQPSGCSFTAGPASNNGDWTHNSYTLAQWANMEAAGAVFLPAAGVRDGTNVFGMGSNGVYWSSTPNSESYANLLDFRSDYLYAMTYGLRHYGFSVRLVRDRE